MTLKLTFEIFQRDIPRYIQFNRQEIKLCGMKKKLSYPNTKRPYLAQCMVGIYYKKNLFP